MSEAPVILPADEWRFSWDCEKQSKPDVYDHVNDRFFKEEWS